MDCPGGHGLASFATEEAGYNCDHCGRDALPAATRLWGCKRCNFDVCEQCYAGQPPEPEPADQAGGRCPAGHALVGFATDVAGYNCDSCGAEELAAGTALWGCKGCDYDVCEQCKG